MYIIMKTLQQILLAVIVFTQIILWSSYYYVLKGKNMKIFWGKIPKIDWNSFLLVALIAYILNILLLFYFVFKEGVKDTYILAILYGMLIYYGLQMYFLPFMELLPKIYTQVLLFLCVIPMGIIAYTSYLQASNVKNIFEKIFLYAGGLIPLYHVLVNDGILYGLNI